MPTEVNAERVADVIEMLVKQEAEERQPIVLGTLRSLLNRGAKDRLVVVAEDSPSGPRSIRNAAIAVINEDHTANLLSFSSHDSAASKGTRDVLFHLQQVLRTRAIEFVQCMRMQSERRHPLLESAGFEYLATLDYRVASQPTGQPGQRERLDSTRDPARAKQSISFVPYLRWYSGGNASANDHDRALELLTELVDATYQDSLDCPKIAEFRSTAQQIRAYRSSPTHNPACWFVLVEDSASACSPDDTPLGCLLLNPEPSAEILELTYMGVIPSCRGRGLGGACLEYCWEVAESLSLRQITLAVDEANEPAARVYAQHGFEILFSETVWGQQL